MSSLLLCTIFTAALGVAMSLYVYYKTQRRTLEHKAMIVLDMLFVAAIVSAMSSAAYNDHVTPVDQVIFWLNLGLAVYVGILTIHHRFECVEHQAEEAAAREARRILDGKR